VILLKEKWSHMASFSIFEIKVYKTFLKLIEGDVTKNRDFIEGKMVAHGQFFIFLYAFI